MQKHLGHLVTIKENGHINNNNSAGSQSDAAKM